MGKVNSKDKGKLGELETVMGYKELANAIIISAVEDIRRYYKREAAIDNIKAAEADTERKSQKYWYYIHIERDYKTAMAFFRSEWYRQLTDVDAEYILKRLERERE